MEMKISVFLAILLSAFIAYAISVSGAKADPVVHPNCQQIVDGAATYLPMINHWKQMAAQERRELVAETYLRTASRIQASMDYFLHEAEICEKAMRDAGR
jgi:hypothetical protein